MILICLAAFVPAVTLLYAGAQHLAHRHGISSTVHAHGVLSPSRARVVGMLLGPAEVLLGLGGLTSAYLGWLSVFAGVMAATAAIYAAFAWYVTRLLGASFDGPCGCLGTEDVVGRPLLWRNVVYGTAALAASAGPFVTDMSLSSDHAVATTAMAAAIATSAALAAELWARNARSYAEIKRHFAFAHQPAAAATIDT